ncbi:VapE domain-containing protein [Fretibacterium fastidiosum]|uniref:VapE domain-containing protein n=1 Tax=Fretibacterium fastidiosum TaxID=651822 RepID=UPI00030D4983|nr:VapE domain-containing protein [Fretibacterium fastidiosum]
MNRPTGFEIEDSFVRWLCDLGIPPAEGERLTLDGQKHRYRVVGDRGTTRNGEYCIYCDERPAGWAKSWSAKHGVEYAVWTYYQPGDSPWSDEEKREYVKRMEAQRAAAARQKELERAKASAEAARKWEAATEPRPEHPYLKKKGLSGAHGARQLGKLLVLPIRNASGALMNIQTIAPDGEKRFHPGAPKAGGFFVMGGRDNPPAPSGHPPLQGGQKSGEPGQSPDSTHDFGSAAPYLGGDREVFLCEGFATGATVHEATGRTVVVAWDCGNLPKVAELLRPRYPGRLVLAADNDHRTPGNPGLAAAFELAERFGIPFTSPVFEADESGSDWNDYAALHGIERTAEEIFLRLEENRRVPELEQHYAWPRWVHERKNGAPMGTLENLQVLLRHEKIGVWYDEIKKDVCYSLPETMEGGKFGKDNRANSIFALVVSLCERYGFPTANLDAYLVAIADENRKNPVMNWIRLRAWDGKDRIGALTETLTLAEWFPDRMKRLLMTRWLISAVAACVADAFKTRGVLVLQGAQAIGKTSWFASLVPSSSGWFLDGVALDPEDKDSLKRVISHWIIELGELEATFKKADINKLKSYITSPVDVVRLPWARKFSDFPRRTVFCASVNQAEFLVDTTGNSRWWCLPCRSINYKHGIDLQQLWAQALSLYRTGEPWWLTKDEERDLDDLNRYFEAGDEIEDAIASGWNWDEYEQDLSMGLGDWMNATSILKSCGMQNPTKMQVRRAGEVLRKLTGREPERRGKARDRCYWMPHRNGYSP